MAGWTKAQADELKGNISRRRIVRVWMDGGMPEGVEDGMVLQPVLLQSNAPPYALGGATPVPPATPRSAPPRQHSACAGI